MQSKSIYTCRLAGGMGEMRNMITFQKKKKKCLVMMWGQGKQGKNGMIRYKESKKEILANSKLKVFYYSCRGKILK